MGQPIGSIFEGQAVQEECREHLATPFIKGMMWVVIGSRQHNDSQCNYWSVKEVEGEEESWIA